MTSKRSTSEISIPTRNRRKLLQALPFAMEERLTEDVDDFHFIPIDWKPGRSTIVAVVSKQRVDEWRERFAAAGMRLFGMAADYQLLPLHPQTEMCVADHGDGRISLLRSNNVGATMDEESLELWWSSSENESVSVAVNDSQLGRRLLQLGGGDIKEWAIGNDFIQWLGQRKGGAPLFNLLPRDETERRREHAIPGLRAALVILAVAALARLGVDGYELYLLEMENRRLTEEINTLFLQTFPGEQRVVNARSQFRRKIEELAQGDGNERSGHS